MDSSDSVDNKPQAKCGRQTKLEDELMQTIDTIEEVLERMTGRWPFRLRLPLRDKRGPFLVRGKARCYHQVPKKLLLKMRKQKLIHKAECVRSDNFCYDEYEAT